MSKKRRGSAKVVRAKAQAKCMRKRPYESKEVADKTLRAIRYRKKRQGKTGFGMYVYKCTVGDHWHIAGDGRNRER